MPLVIQVSHLSEASSFFLSALQPLGYRYTYGRGGSIGLGIFDVDVLLEQADFGRRLRPSKVRFHATSRSVVREFYAAALYAGGRPFLSPGDSREKNAFNAQILDLDGNNIEVTFSDTEEESFLGHDGDQTAVLAWQKDVAKHPGRASFTGANSSHSAPSARRGAADGSRKSIVDDAIEEKAKSITSQARAKSDAATEVIPRVESQQRQDIMPSMIRQLSGGIESLLLRANNVTGVIEKKTVVGTALGAAAGAAIAYAMCTSEDGKIKREQYRITEWRNGDRSSYSQSSSARERWHGIAQSVRSGALPELMSRLTIEPPAPPQAPEAPTTKPQPLMIEQPIGRSVAVSGLQKGSGSVTSRHTTPARSRSHASRSSRRRSASAHSSRHSKRSSGASSRGSMTLVDDSYERSSKYDKKYEDELDLDDESVAPSDSISMAGDKYSRRGMVRASHGKRSNSSYVGEKLSRIVENDREGDAQLSARRVSKAYY